MLVDEEQKEGRGIVVFWAVLPMLLLFLFAFGCMRSSSKASSSSA